MRSPPPLRGSHREGDRRDRRRAGRIGKDALPPGTGPVGGHDGTGSMSLDEHRLTVLMRDSVEGLRHPNRWSEVPGRAAKATRRRRVRQLAAGTIITAAAAITAVVAVAPAR